MNQFSQSLQTFHTLRHYAKAKRVQSRVCYGSREGLERYQQRQLKKFAQQILAKSPYFQTYQDLPLQAWPVMDKVLMMAQFDQMNTAGLRKNELLVVAQQAELTRDFAPMLGAYSVGLSSGTSGQRGLFVASPKERAIWAGTILAKLLPRGLLHGERIALFLRADNQLYQNVNNRFLSLNFFDLFAPFDEQCQRLEQYQPSIVVAPAQVLRALALKKSKEGLKIDPVLLLSAAEVLLPQDKTLLQQSFQQVGEVYQATEGFLGATCKHGTLHLNEEYLHVEPEWLDEERFTPIITDFTRETQPIVRYRLDDVLVIDREPCPCGTVAMAIKRIEGRCDDQLLFLHPSGVDTVTIFADVCHRAIAQVLPLEADYQLTQSGRLDQPVLTLGANVALENLHQCQMHLSVLFEKQGAQVKGIQWRLEPNLPATSFQQKRRRIVRAKP